MDLLSILAERTSCAVVSDAVQSNRYSDAGVVNGGRYTSEEFLDTRSS